MSSQIDFILTRAKDRRNTTDARAIPNISLDTDHRPVIMTLQQIVWRNKKAKHRPGERINLRVLSEEETKQKFKDELGQTLTGTDLDALSMDETWSIFKAPLKETLSKACGVKKAAKDQSRKHPGGATASRKPSKTTTTTSCTKHGSDLSWRKITSSID